MSLREILIYPDKRLRKKSVPVKRFDKKLNQLLDDMAETMYHAPGVGLAAPQIGKNVRIIVVDINVTEDKVKELKELINPKIVESYGTQISEEGCLSVPGFLGNINRNEDIVVEALNRKGENIVIKASELLSRVLQHEIDHLDGILFFDRMSKLKRQLFKRKVEKALGSE
ncbi:MAG: peptide deformylase [Thermodesulfobacteriota bacterium]